MRKPLLIAAPILAALALFTVLRHGGSEHRPTPLPAAAQAATTAVALSASSLPAATASIMVGLSPEDSDFLDGLRGKFGPALRGRHGQIRAIEQVMAWLMERYPDDWRSRMQAFLQALSPELAAAMLAQFENLERYQDWLRDNRERLGHLDSAQRHEELWRMRRELFGNEAAEEIWAAERRSQQLQASLATLGRDDGRRVDEKFDSYLQAIRSSYGQRTDAILERRGTELMNRFLEVDAVQRQLTAMAPAERKLALRGLRERMGMDTAALQRWDTLDSERDRQWDQGQSYQLQRARVVAQYSGSEQASRLRELQERSFGAEQAEIIRGEEASGFYRYAQDRRIGRE